MVSPLAVDPDAGPAEEAPPEPSVKGEHLRACVAAHLPAVWRILRRSGVPEGEADDAAQKVFLIFARKRKDVLPGRELAFLLSTALRVASETRRAHRRRREVFDVSVETRQSTTSGPEVQLLQREALRQLDVVLMQLDEPLRVVFVLF
jgi:RNA polymerase sigma-70 factor (ECF subfamily)